MVAELQVRLTLGQLTRGKQLLDRFLTPHVQDVVEGRPTEYNFRNDGVLCFRDRVVEPNDGD